MEYEIKVLDIDVNTMRKKLKSIGCKRIHKAKMFKRNVYHLCDKELNGFARVRDEGTNVTMTVKIKKHDKYPHETEVSINEDFDKAGAFMESLGVEQKSFQESIREKYSHPLAHEITIDDIPGIPTYMEIDCVSEKNLNKLILLLGVDKEKTKTGSFDVQFDDYYGIAKNDFNKMKSLTFRNIKNEIKPHKNKTLFQNVISRYTEKFIKDAEKPLKQIKTIRKQCKKCKTGTRKKCVPTQK